MDAFKTQAKKLVDESLDFGQPLRPTQITAEQAARALNILRVEAGSLAALDCNPTLQAQILHHVLSITDGLSSLTECIQTLNKTIANIRSAFSSLKAMPRNYIHYLVNNPKIATTGVEKALVQDLEIHIWVYDFERKTPDTNTGHEWKAQVMLEEVQFRNIMRCFIDDVIDVRMMAVMDHVGAVIKLIDQVRDATMYTEFGHRWLKVVSESASMIERHTNDWMDF